MKCTYLAWKIHRKDHTFYQGQIFRYIHLENKFIEF